MVGLLHYEFTVHIKLKLTPVAELLPDCHPTSNFNRKM